MLKFNESHRQRITVTADDFGISSRANRNILYLISIGKIDRIGVMVNGTISEKEISELERSGVKIDIHLDILHELDQNRKKRGGAIARGLDFLGKIITGKVSTAKVSADWENQINKFQEIFGRNPDGINSHEHVHLFPPFFKISTQLANKHSIPFVRFGDSIFIRHHNMVSHIMHYLRKINLKTFSQSGCVSTGSLISLDWIKNVDKF
ncbi:MAG: ChbG/HpnK family deacetylase, partial [Candidatus Moranbacteria bacterium]|nr:ChbG/HpnK family deacetylase [Candidatus Moranbacteria bacterium]